MSASRITKYTRCPRCAENGLDTDANNLVTYHNGDQFCHACRYIVKQTDEDETIEPDEFVGNLLKNGIYKDIPNRGITKQTCEFFGYQTAIYSGAINKSHIVHDEIVHIENYMNDQYQIVGQKVRSTTEKNFGLRGSSTSVSLFGKHKYSPSSNVFIVITEGALDAMTIAQVQGLHWPVVSIANGAATAKRELSENLTYLQGFKYVILAFDNDAPGKKATLECISLFEPGKVKVLDWPLKDANDMLMANRGNEIRSLIWNARVPSPDHIVTVSDILDKILEQPQRGIDMPWPTWNAWTYGLRFNEITTLVGPSGAGKTEIVKDIVSHLLDKVNVGVFSFEQSPADTIRRYVGAKLQIKLQKPGEVWDPEKITKTAMGFNEKIYLYDFNGKVNLDDIFYSIRFLSKAKNCKFFVIDNLKSLKVVFSKEQCAEFAVKLKATVKELGVHVLLVSHVNKDGIRQSTHVGFSSKVDEPHKNLNEDDVKHIMNKFKLDWENGRIPTASNIEGGNDIEAISDYVMAIGRNKQSEDETERRTIRIKLLKEGRIDSDHRVREFSLYRQDDGTLVELGNII